MVLVIDNRLFMSESVFVLTKFVQINNQHICLCLFSGYANSVAQKILYPTLNTQQTIAHNNNNY